MKFAGIVFWGFVATAGTADLERGAEVVRENHCLECHSIQRRGARTAPELSETFVERFTPSALASVLWNQTPTMWHLIGGNASPQPTLKDSDSEAMFAYLYSLRVSDISGLEKRGAQTFEKKGCAECQQVTDWRAPLDPLGLAQQMWNHFGVMTATATRQSLQRPTVSAQDLADIAAYAREARGLPPAPDTSAMPADLDQIRQTGKQWIEINCRTCHQSGMALEKRLANRSYSGIAAEMWNHLSKMIEPPAPASEMRARSLMFGNCNIWVRPAQLFEDGRFLTARTAPNATMIRTQVLPLKELFTPFSMVALGWKHGRQQAQAGKQRVWPTFSTGDISDLIAKVNSRP